MKKSLLFAAAFTKAVFGFSQASNLSYSNWDVVLEDNFNYSNINLPSQLSTNWDFDFVHGPAFPNLDSFGRVYHAGYATPESFSIENPGYLTITMFKKTTPYIYEGNEHYFATGVLRSKIVDHSFATDPIVNNNRGMLYGMFEIRCKIPSGAGVTPAFWLAGTHGWPPEIDVFEVGWEDKRVFFASVHDGIDDVNNCGVHFEASCSLDKGFHTYTAKWTPTHITFYLDGKELFTKTSPYTNHAYFGAMDLITNLGVWYNDNQNNYKKLVIDYIKIFKPKKSDELNAGNLPSNVKKDLVWSESKKTLFYVANDNSIYNTYWDTWSQSTGFWNHGKVKWDAPSNYASNLVWSEDRKALFYRGTDNNIYNIYWDTWTQPYGFWNYGKVKWDAPANCAGDIVWAEDRDIIFYRGTDNNIYHIYWDTWSQSYGFWNYGKVNATAPANCSGNLVWSENRDALFYKGTDNNIYNLYLSNSNWIYGKVKLNAPANCAGDLTWSESRNALFYKGTDNKIHNLYWNTWTLPYGVWDYGLLNYVGSPDINLNSTYNSELKWSEKDQSLYYKGVDTRIYKIQWINNQWNLIVAKWHKVGNLHNSNTDVIGNLCFANNQNKIFYKNANNKIGQIHFENFNILNPTCGNEHNRIPHTLPIQSCFNVTSEVININNQNDIELYPMPFSNILNIKGLQFDEFKFEIYNSLGVIVKHGTIISNQIDLSDLSSGIYILKMKSSSKSYTNKIVKK